MSVSWNFLNVFFSTSFSLSLPTPISGCLVIHSILGNKRTLISRIHLVIGIKCMHVYTLISKYLLSRQVRTRFSSHVLCNNHRSKCSSLERSPRTCESFARSPAAYVGWAVRGEPTVPFFQSPVKKCRNHGEGNVPHVLRHLPGEQKLMGIKNDTVVHPVSWYVWSNLYIWNS